MLSEPLQVSAERNRLYKGYQNVHAGDPIGGKSGGALFGQSGGRWWKLSAFPQPVTADFAIKPIHIRRRESIGLFGASGAEALGSDLVWYAQDKGDWVSFTADEIKKSTSELEGFVDFGWLVKDDDRYGYTMGLVFEFYSAYPANSAENAQKLVKAQELLASVIKAGEEAQKLLAGNSMQA